LLFPVVSSQIGCCFSGYFSPGYLSIVGQEALVDCWVSLKTSLFRKMERFFPLYDSPSSFSLACL
jgi:hypothetical protein